MVVLVGNEISTELSDFISQRIFRHINTLTVDESFGGRLLSIVPASSELCPFVSLNKCLQAEPC